METNSVSANNKRIAINTLMLYIRMFLTMAVTFYTSRVVLQVLGVTDFGIYNVVGGVVVMFSFLNASMSGATSRFLTFEMANGTMQTLRQTFGNAMSLHLIIAGFILLIAETVGLWFVLYKLVIPPERIETAVWVYQFSILTMMVTVTQVPYNAIIIAHERMNVYAYVEILNVLLRLGIVFLLIGWDKDKLLFYAILLFGVSFIVAMTYRVYCVRHFAESRSRLYFQRKRILPMLSFSGWDLYGNMSTVARTQGINMLLNIFFGPALNAANGVATQVQAGIMGFASNIVIAVKPQIIKSYATGNYERGRSLVFNASKGTFLLLLLLSLPLIFEMQWVLSLWLGNVPAHAASFCVLTLLFNFFATMSFVVVTVAHAAGKIKRPSLINGTLYLSVIPISYLMFYLGGAPETSYIYNVVAVGLGLLGNVWTAHFYVPGFSFYEYFFKVFCRCMLVLLLASVIIWSVRELFPSASLYRFLAVGLASTLSIVFIGMHILFNHTTRVYIWQMIRKKIWSKA